MRRAVTVSFLIAAVGCGLVLHGCFGQTPLTTYYTLSPIETASPGAGQTVAGDDVNIGIGPVTFPDELDRQRIVTRSGRNRIEINEFHRWGGSLEHNFVRVLTENLSLLLNSNRVMALPWERHFNPDYRVVMDVRRFDGRLGEFASLNATWMILKKGSDQPLVIRQTIVQETIATEGYEPLVAAQSAAAATISREIAKELKKQMTAAP
ncbi:MAG: membrane integrity-associated transporter subunit PqiC [Desulfosarcina sp.]|nr:membrane integrity-associated transporter subunit PqiC [Desulfobacterales bacterium]